VTDASPAALYAQAVKMVIDENKASAVLLQQRLGLNSYSVAVAMLIRMQAEGIVSPVGPAGRIVLRGRNS
jgi:DNA segregation ATPase FtsK/SpoIIIE-like protein